MPEEPAILYFPGIHRLPEELRDFFELLQAHTGRQVHTCPVPYDTGEFTSRPFEQWLRQFSDSQPWWVGLSLGASVAWLLAASVPESLRPQRLILVNPFADRCKLAQTMGFSMRNQWDLSPEQTALPASMDVDLVISLLDTKIPLSHKQNLLPQLPPTGRVHFLRADHALSTPEFQQSLFHRLFPTL